MIRLRYTKKNGKLKERRKNNLEKMAYSRWSDSKYYTYWNSTKVYDKGDEIFICHTSIDRYHGFTYTECKELVLDLTKLKGRINEIVGDEDATELQGYIKEFVKDVDKEYDNV